MHPVKHFDQAVLVVLIEGVEALRRERDIEIFVVHKVHLRRAILVLSAAKAIDQAQSTGLLRDVATAWQYANGHSTGSVEAAIDGEQTFAVLHAQAYMPLITNAVTRPLA